MYNPRGLNKLIQEEQGCVYCSITGQYVWRLEEVQDKRLSYLVLDDNPNPIRSKTKVEDLFLSTFRPVRTILRTTLCFTSG